MVVTPLLLELDKDAAEPPSFGADPMHSQGATQSPDGEHSSPISGEGTVQYGGGVLRPQHAWTQTFGAAQPQVPPS